MSVDSPPRGLRAALPGEALGGRQARLVGAPANVAELAQLLARCHGDGLVTAVRGTGSKIDWGPVPARVDVLFDLAQLTSPLEHQADDHLVRLSAGTTIRAAQAALSGSRQRLPLDPGSVTATIGGLLATDEAGPLRHRYGPPSQQVVSLQVALASGETATVGRQIAPLLCGTFGALGIITAATFRVTARPARRRWLSHPVRTPLELHDVVGDLVRADLPIAAIEVDMPATLDRATLCVLVEGDEQIVAASQTAIADVLGERTPVSSAAPAWWGSYPFGAGDIALRLTAPAGDLHAAIYALRDAAGRTPPVRGSAGVGCVYAALPGDLPVARVAGILDATRHAMLARGGSVVVLRAPRRYRQALDLFGERGGDALGARLKSALDPAGLFAASWPGTP
jgi:glycolate oxidase FAD binding subunit